MDLLNDFIKLDGEWGGCTLCFVMKFVLCAMGFMVLVFSMSRLMGHSYDVRDKHVVITGGSSGIGLECAKEYVRQGAKVTIIARNVTKLEAARLELESVALANNNNNDNDDGDDGKKKNKKRKNSFSGRVQAIAVDVGLATEVDKKIQEAVAQFGPVGVLVNCAGTSVAGEFMDLPVDEFEKMLNVNVLGSIYPTRAALKSMVEQGEGGRVIFVASQVAQCALHGYTAYATSKWALRGLAEALQMEVKPHGIFVSVCYPPDTDTPGYEVEMQSKPELTKQLSESGSLFKPHEVAADLVRMSSRGYFGISTGLDGWLLKMLHPGMGPVNDWWEALQPVIFSPLARIIAFFYVLSWDWMCSAAVKNESKSKGTATAKSKSKTKAA